MLFVAPLAPQYVLFVPTDDVMLRLLYFRPLVLDALIRLLLPELLALLPSLAKPLLELRKVVVVADVAVEHVDLEWRRRRFFRSCFL